MTELTLPEKLTNLLVDHFGVKKEDITLHAELGNDLSLDNVEVADLISMIEKEWHIEIGEDAAPSNLKTFDDLVRIVEEHSNEF